MKAPTADNEAERLAALDRYNILDTPREPEFDEITELLAHICNVPIAVVNLIGADRQWFKSERGLGTRQTPLETSFCAHAILQPGLFVVPDTTRDDRFAGNPLVSGEPYLRFYAGALLETPDGYPLGTLCVLDTEPRQLTTSQLDALGTLADHVMNLLELRRAMREREQLNKRLEASLKAQKRLIDTVAHDLRTPLGTIALTAQQLEETAVEEEARETAQRLRRAAQRMGQLADDLIAREELGVGVLSMEPGERDLEAIVAEVVDLLAPIAAREDIALKLEPYAELPRVCCDAFRTGQVLTNVVGNAVKFTPAGGEVVVRVEALAEEVRVTVRDDGPGIAAGEVEAVFEPFWRSPDASAGGTGLGLAIARRLIEAQGGRIGLESELGQGTLVWFTLPLAGAGRSMCEGEG